MVTDLSREPFLTVAELIAMEVCVGTIVPYLNYCQRCKHWENTYVHSAVFPDPLGPTRYITGPIRVEGRKKNQ